ncbi:putative F-box protein At1g50870, partial [Arabidopsis lyrata subsp. lyrata]
FTNKFETRFSTRPSLLVFFKNKDKLFVFSFPHHNQNSNEPRSFSQHVDCYHMKYPKDCSFPFAESVHGLICFRTSVNRHITWNPSMRQFVKLTKPGKRWKDIKVFLGYDPIEGKHKVVCMRRGYKVSGEYCRVLTLGSAQQSWRTVKTNHKHFAYIGCYARCINGVLYYAALLDDDSDASIIMSFDVRTEKFDMIKLPLNDFWGMMISYEGRLSYLDYYNPMDNGGIKLWILEDKEKHI